MDMEEHKRIQEVQRFLQLDFDKRKEFRDITDLASELCKTPISLITLLDKDINWIKVGTGVNLKSSPRATSFCHYGIKQDGLIIIPDATKDERFDNNPLVYEMPRIRFYAGVPLVSSNGYKLGTLCLFDIKPNNLTELQKKTLTILSRQVTFLMELELGQTQLLSHITELESKNESLQAIAHIQSHDIRQPLTSIVGLVNLIKDGQHSVDEVWLQMITEATSTLDIRIHSIVNESLGNKDLKLARFNKMVEEIEDYAILLLDKNGNIENWNKGAQKIKGYTSSEIVGKNFSVFYTSEDCDKGLPKSLLAKAVNENVAREEGFRVRKDGTRFLARIVITAIHDDAKEVIGFTKVTRDLTNMIQL